MGSTMGILWQYYGHAMDGTMGILWAVLWAVLWVYYGHTMGTMESTMA